MPLEGRALKKKNHFLTSVPARRKEWTAESLQHIGITTLSSSCNNGASVASARPRWQRERRRRRRGRPRSRTCVSNAGRVLALQEARGARRGPPGTWEVKRRLATWRGMADTGEGGYKGPRGRWGRKGSNSSTRVCHAVANTTGLWGKTMVPSFADNSVK